MIQDARPRNDAPRLDAWDRYARILADQVAALEQGEPDLDRFNELAEERERLAVEIDGLGQPSGRDPDGSDVIARIRERLEACRIADRAVLDRLAELRGGTRQAVTDIGDRRAGRARYTGAAAPPAGGQRVDVTS